MEGGVEGGMGGGGEGRKGKRRGEILKMSRVWPGLRRNGGCSLVPWPSLPLILIACSIKNRR